MNFCKRLAESHHDSTSVYGFQKKFDIATRLAESDPDSTSRYYLQKKIILKLLLQPVTRVLTLMNQFLFTHTLAVRLSLNSLSSIQSCLQFFFKSFKDHLKR